MIPRFLWVIALCWAAAGCERAHSDMADQDKALPYQPSTFFPDGASARPLVTGVVARPDADVPGYPFATHHSPEATPPAITADVLAHGQERFDTFCAVCHGRLGNGEGMIVQRGFTRPPSFHIDRLRNAPDAHLYDVITHGYGAMFGYAERVTPAERWEIIAYIRALQLAPDAAGPSLPDATRQALVAGGDRKTPGSAGGGG